MGQRIILAGGGHAHLSVLADWAKLPPAQTERWLLTSSRYTAYSGMLPGWLAGNYRSADLMIDLDPQARYAGVHLVIADIIGLDADAKTIQLSSGVQMGFDLASLATGGEANVTSLLALGDKLLPVKPVDSFVAKWSAFVERSQLRGTARVIVVGGGAAGVEMAIGTQPCAAYQFTQSFRWSVRRAASLQAMLKKHGTWRWMPSVGAASRSILHKPPAPKMA